MCETGRTPDAPITPVEASPAGGAGSAGQPPAPLVEVTIDGRAGAVQAGTTVLAAARQLGIRIPSLCAHPDLRPAGVCRVCVVEVDGRPGLVTSCFERVREPITVRTQSRRVRDARRMTVALLMTEHYGDCLDCGRSGSCELQSLAREVEAGSVGLPRQAAPRHELDRSSPAVVRDLDKCLLCGRCVRTCAQLQEISCLGFINRGVGTKVATGLDQPLDEAVCIGCGQCITHCPTGALREADATAPVWAALTDPDKHVVIQTAPAPRAAIGECFGLPPGRPLTGQLNTALRACGFDRVFDTTVAADLTIMEEGAELLGRLHRALAAGDASTALPLFTSCSPGWVSFLEQLYPQFIPHLSSAKSPQQMFGALLKTRYAAQTGIDPARIVSVALMPCTAKKAESARAEMAASGYRDVDHVLTTREAAAMVHSAGIDLPALEGSGFDDPFGTASGSGVVFGITGGVMESALRTVVELVAGEPVERYFDQAAIVPVRGMQGVRTAEITIPRAGPVPELLSGLVPDFDWLRGTTLRLAVVHGTANARRVLADIEAGGQLAGMHFIEFMACPGGCLGGGGQPIPTSEAIRRARAAALYAEDEAATVRKAHQNPDVLRLYAEFLTDGPGGRTSHHLLHTGYTPRSDDLVRVAR